MRETLARRIEELSLSGKVRLCGNVEQASRLFAGFDAMVLGSHREPFGMVLLEAMVAGLPVVYGKGGGAPEVMGESGIAFECGDSESLVRAMDRCLALTEEDRWLLAGEMRLRLEQHFSLSAGARRFLLLPAVASRISAGSQS